MRPLYLFLAALALCGALAFAFNSSAYLYDNEKGALVTSEKLSADSNATYVLYRINSNPALMTANDVLMSDQGQIEAVLAANYRNTVLPSQDEFKELKADFKAFNDSRNVKTRLAPYGVELMCTQSTGLVAIPCNSTTECFGTANVVCGLYASNGGGSGCYPDVLAPLIFDYSTALQGFSSNMPYITRTLDSLNADNAQSKLADIQSRISGLKSSAGKISSNALRFPEGSDKCPNCIGLCASPHFDTASLDAANNKITSILTRMSLAGSPSSTAKQVSKSTSDRSAYLKNLQVLAIWQPKWDAFKANYSSLKDQATDMAAYVKDSNFTSAAQVFSDTWPKMDSRMGSRNFEGIESDFASLQAAVPALQASLKQGAKPYSSARSAQNNASDALVRARWQTNLADKASVDSYNSLAARKKTLDASFMPPMTAAEYSALTSKYLALQADEERHILAQDGAAGSAYRLGEKFGQTAVSGVFSLTDALVVLPASTRTQVAPIIPPVVLFLADLALVAAGLAVFIGALLYFKPIFRNRSVLGVWVLALFVFLFMLGIGSVSMFLLINQSAHEGTLADYLSLVSRSGGASYVAIDQGGASPDAVTAMSSCAANITGQLKARFLNASTSTFSFLGNVCAWGPKSNYTLVQCMDKTGAKPVIFLHYSKAAKPPEFSVVYQKQADVYGDLAAYSRCEIGDVIN